MTALGTGRRLVVLALLGTAAALDACSNDDGTKKPCPTEPAFLLTLRAVPGPLPEDIELTVEFGGGSESYKLADPVHSQETVLCEIETEDAGTSAEGGVEAGADAGASPAVALHCEVWSQGAAKVTVTATGYPSILKREIEATQDSSHCIRTKPVDVVLGDKDAGN